MDTETEPLFELAVRAVADACRLSRGLQRALDRLPALEKADASPVTVADHAVQALIAHRLQLSPGSLVGEESSAALRGPEAAGYVDVLLQTLRPYWPEVSAPALLDAIDSGDGAGGAGAFWTIDPIDGTRGFIADRHYAIALARVEAGRPVFAVLGCPRLSDEGAEPCEGEGLVFQAALGEGCWSRPVRDLGARRRVEVRPDLEPCLVESAESRRARPRHEAYAAAGGLRFFSGLKVDAQTKYALLARGDAQAYLRLRDPGGYKEAIWDHAAGALVASEAGAQVSDQDGRPLDFSRGRRLEANNGVVAATPALHAGLIAGSAAWRWAG